MKVKIQIKSIFGKLLFEFEKENNTIKDTVLEALESDADLRRANLIGADLRRANLRHADLSGADLRRANLIGADLRRANLSDATLRHADLGYADLIGATLRHADLGYAGLIGADLRHADLSYADLSYADLSGADLRHADLIGADLRHADLSYADLSGADLRRANLSFSPCLFSTKADKKYIQIGGIGSSNRCTTYCIEDDKIWCGCFSGSLSEFKEQVLKTHAENKRYKEEYLSAISFIETQIEINKQNK